MKILTAAQIEKLGLDVYVSNKKSDIVAEVSRLKPGESAFISNDEWQSYGYKSNPSNIISTACYHHRSMLYGKKLSIRTVKDGWVVIMVKQEAAK